MVDYLYKNSMDNIRFSEDLEKNIINYIFYQKTGKKSHPYLRKGLITMAAGVTLFLLFSFSAYEKVERLIKKPATEEQASPSNIIEREDEKREANIKSDNLILMVYTVPEETKDLYLTPSYAEETIASPLKPDIQIPLARYNPLMSSVPGFPLTFHYNLEDGKEIWIEAETNFGKLLSWDQKNGIVANNHKRMVCKPGDTIYWSPLGEEALPDLKNNITVTAFKDDKSLEEQIIVIEQKNGSCFAYLKE